MHRCDLHTAIKEKALQFADIQTGCNIVSIDTSSPSVTLDSGQVFYGDLVVGADGLQVLIHPCKMLSFTNHQSVHRPKPRSTGPSYPSRQMLLPLAPSNRQDPRAGRYQRGCPAGSAHGMGGGGNSTAGHVSLHG